MPLGDSITYGDGSTHCAGYRKDLWRRLSLAGHEVEFVGSEQDGTAPADYHEGHPGWEIDDIAGQVVRWLPRHRPTEVLLHIGTNDLDRGADVGRASASLALLVDSIVRTAPAATLFVATLAPVRSTVVRARVQAFNAQVPPMVAARAAAGRLVRHVDIGAMLTDADLADDLHPNDLGYAKMAGAWFAALTAR